MADLSDVPAHLRVGAHLTLEQAAEAEDRGEQVVEVVSDAACQLADGLHLLGLAQLLLEAEPLGDVLGEHEPGAPAFELDPVRENFHVDEGPVLLPVLGVAHRRRATVLSGQRRFESGDLAGRPDVGQGHPQEFLARPPVAGYGRLIDGEEPEGTRVVDEHRLWVRLEQQAIACLTAA